MFNGDISEINLIYGINHWYTKIFDSHFINNNKDKCKMIIDNKEYELMEEFNIEGLNNNNNILEIELKIYQTITDISFMFYRCSSLISLPDISKWNTDKVIDMSWMFYGCSSLSSLPDISKWNTDKVIDMSGMFEGCSSLST